ncbi:MAG: hypothetical protein HN742_14615 [Lentisphaerae bacterium]|nr:hypothetical protein [Lentisphaerota bacterium]MBT4823227.1 hypothetical protein [Lentisphaerota bacterium]MBT5607476.1 hypothetical protein [Lentisphaerota bacterium]MBT7055756.1 hypothetical protein [Lentisphaerota bacterium]MBT7843109.1 hypothetical protein [Lentisphaerota bacterium]
MASNIISSIRVWAHIQNGHSMDRARPLLLPVLLLLTFPLRAAENPAMPKKMCWAHFCGWGFNVRTMYDEPERFARLYDRTLLGEHTGTDLGVTSSRRDQIREAMRYGINGFCVDIPRLDGYGALGSLYRGAEGLPFKIALCVDGWHGTMDEVVNALATFLTKWGQHPNNYFINGRPVVFIYKHSRTPEECRTILKRLAKQGLQAHWLVQPQRETGLWGDAERLQSELEVFDGLYDFGVNGFTVDQMTARLRNGRAALGKSRPDGLLCAGISQGYLGPHNGFYRPFLGTGTLRDNWAAALAAEADWVCLCTWNDYNETTHFEPSVWGRDVMLKLNRELIRQWRGKPAPNRTPQVFVSYKDEVTLGDDWHLEVTSLPYTTPSAICRIRILDLGGNTIHESEEIDLPGGSLFCHRYQLNSPGFHGPRELRIQAAVCVGNDEPTWQELYPIVIRPGGMRSWRTVRFDLNDLFSSPRIQTKETPEGTRLSAVFRSWSWWGRAELLRNGTEIASQDIAKFGPVDTAVGFLVKPEDRRRQRDLFTIRLTRRDRRLTYSPPVALGEWGTDTVDLPALVRGTDFDEGWRERHWRTPWRLDASEIRTATVPDDELWRVLLPLDNDTGDTCEDRGGWRVQACRGVSNRWGGTKPALQPAWATMDVQGQSRTALRFDGRDDNVTFPFRTLPPGAFTVEFLVRPTGTGPQTVFSDQNGGLTVRLDAEGKLVTQRSKTRLAVDGGLPVGSWHHLAVTYDYHELRVHRDGLVTGRTDCPASLRGINSRPVIGALCREGRPLSEHFAGDLAGFAITARPLTPGEFVLAR